jgi:N6-adenosine-specific RNA methylase IME4
VAAADGSVTTAGSNDLLADLVSSPVPSAALMTIPAWPWPGLHARAYRCILADPPWHFQNFSAAGEAKNPLAHYDCMPLDAIKALPVAMLAHPVGAALVMWATAPMLPQALDVLQAWGFRFVTVGAWAKQSSSGTAWAFGTGYWLRSAAEFFLIGTVGDIGPLNRATRNLIVAPIREHSRKPDCFRDVVETLLPGPRAELFARERVPSWDAWGNQVDLFTPSVESKEQP